MDSRPLRFSHSVQVGLAILQLFSGDRRELGIMDIADLLGLTRSTAHRYTSTFVRLGRLEQNEARKYMLAPSSADPALSVIGAMRRELPVLSVLEGLRDRTGYTVSLGVLDGTHVTYLHRLFGCRRGQYVADAGLGTGTHLPVYCTALGKAILAGLAEAERCRIVSAVDFVPYGPKSIMNAGDLLVELSRLDCREPIVSDREFLSSACSIAMYVPRGADKRRIAIDVTVPSAALTVQELVEIVGPRLRVAVELVSRWEQR